MQGHKPPTDPPLFIYVDPYAQLPRSAFYEALGKHLDLEWVRKETEALYAAGVGRPSLDPVVFVKLMLVGYFENLVGDSDLAFRVADSLTVRRFLGYSLEERTPERTTILKTRQRWPMEVFAAIFNKVLAQLAEHGLVKGEHLATDTVLIDANASLDRLVHRELGCSYSEYVKALYAQDGATPGASEIAAKDAKRPHKGSNAEWESTTDPDAAIAVHPDGHTALSYRLDATMDSDTGAIVQIGVEPGNVRDSVDLPQRLEEAKENLAELGLAPETLTADRGHHSEENLVELEAQGVRPIIRQRSAPGAPGFRSRDFVYQPETDDYTCPAGAPLRRKETDRKGQRSRYKASGKVCRACVHFGICTKSKSGREIGRSSHQAELDRNRERVRSPEGRDLLGKHRQRAEGPWSYAKLYGGLARLGPRGLTNAWKKALIQGIGWNLMKLIARRTGLAPRGRSACAEVLAAVSSLEATLVASICHLLVLALICGQRRAQTRGASPISCFIQKQALSRGC